MFWQAGLGEGKEQSLKTERPAHTVCSKGAGDEGEERKEGKTVRFELNSGEVEVKTDVSDEEHQEIGKRAPKRAADPRVPTEAEVREHNLTHVPCRSWCVHCVRGRGESAEHRRQQSRPEGAVPELHLDYCFMGQKSRRSPYWSPETVTPR